MSKRIAIEDFAATHGGGRVSYGTDTVRVATALRQFADLLEREAIGLCSVNLEGVCDPKEFTVNVLTIKFFDLKDPE